MKLESWRLAPTVTVIDLILELCKFPADLPVQTKTIDFSDRTYGRWGEDYYEDIDPPYTEMANGVERVIIE